MTSPAKRKIAVSDVMKKHNVSERRACRALNLNRSGVRYEVKKLPDEDALTTAIIKKAGEYG